MRRAWVIASGTELTLGQSVDTNSAWLAARLAALGIRTERIVVVPDDAAALRDALLQAAGATDAILLTGGLGPTDDDLTRQVLADVVGVPLELDPLSIEHLRAFFAARGRDMPERNTVQALVPRTARAIPNACGTAPGVRIAVRGTPCFALPGVPFEMRAMFDRDVAPELRAAAGGAVLLSRRLQTFGLGESDVGGRIADLMQRGRDPEVGTTADLGVIGVRINATAMSADEATRRLDDTEAEIRRRLGDAIFGRDDDTLAAVVGRMLTAAAATLSTAESCTGGLLGALITEVAGSSNYYRGGVVSYANEAKIRLLGVSAADVEQHGAVSEAVARAMADGAGRLFDTPYALAVTGIAGPAGGTPEKPVGLVLISLCSPAGSIARECRFGSDPPRQVIRMRAAHTALNLLRLALLRETQPVQPP